MIFFSINNFHKFIASEAPTIVENEKPLNALAKDSTTRLDLTKRTYTYKATEGRFTKKELNDSFALVKKQIENSIANVKIPEDKKKLGQGLKVGNTVQKAIRTFTGFIYDDEDFTNAIKTKKKTADKFLDKIFGD